jgi:hypothetical protein
MPSKAPSSSRLRNFKEAHTPKLAGQISTALGLKEGHEKAHVSQPQVKKEEQAL